MLQDDFILRLIILYVCREYGDSITNPELTKFIMDGQEVDYFNLQYNIYELVKMEHLRVFTDSGKHYYELTEEGKETAGFFQSKIPMRRESRNSYVQSKWCLGTFPKFRPWCICWTPYSRR